MMTRFLRLATSTFLLLAPWMFGCQNADRLERTIREELAKGERYDSLFLGIKFGVSRDEFYDQCWDLNRQKLIKEGMDNMSAEYIFRDSLDQPISLNFYPELTEGPIHTYKTIFYYYAWMPSHRHFQSDKMLEFLPHLFMKWYGGNKSFSQVKDGKLHYYKIDGNRMIDMYIVNEREVAAIYKDLTNSANYPIK